MNKFKNWFLSNFICPILFIDGHDPEPYLIETDDVIYSNRCKLCKYPLGIGVWKINNINPPNAKSGAKQTDWVNYCNDYYHEHREKVITIMNKQKKS